MKMNALIIVGSILIVLFLILKDDTDDVYECSNLPMTDDIVCDENKDIEKRSSTDVFSHRLVFENDGKMNENQLLNPCELKRFIQGYLRKMHNICVDVSNIKHQVHTPSLGLNTYSIFFDIEDYTNYEDIEGFQVNMQDWCDTDGMVQYAATHNINIGTPRACLKADGDITDTGRFTGDVLTDFKYNVSDEYAIPATPLTGRSANYANAISFLNDGLVVRNTAGDIIEPNFDFRPREAPDSISEANLIFEENKTELGCQGLSEGVPTLMLPLPPPGGTRPTEGSPMRIGGCKSKCASVDESDTQIIQNRDSLDFRSIGILSHTDIPASERQNPYPNDLDQKDISCSEHYSSRPNEELPKVTCDTDSSNYTFIGLENNPCQRHCTLHPDIDQEAYKITNNSTGNIMDAKFFKMPYGSTVDSHTVTCDNNYSYDPDGSPPSFVSDADGYACSDGGGFYSLQNCEKDYRHPRPRDYVGYNIDALRRINPHYVPKHILESDDNGVLCDTMSGYSGTSVKILVGNNERNYYIPTGCYKHSYCNVLEATCFQETMFFNFEEGSVPTNYPDDNIIGVSPDFTPKPEYRTIVDDLKDMIIGSYAMKRVTVSPDPSQDIEQLISEQMTEIRETFQIKIISTKYIDSYHGHMIIYRVTCDSDDCELMQVPLADYVFEEEIPDNIYSEGIDAARSGFDTGLAFSPGTGDIASTGTRSPETTGITLPPIPIRGNIQIIFKDGTSLEITLSEAEDIKNIWLRSTTANSMISLMLSGYNTLELSPDDINQLSIILPIINVDTNRLENDDIELFLKAYIEYMESNFGLDLEPHADYICGDFDGISGMNIAACSEEVGEPRGGGGR